MSRLSFAGLERHRNSPVPTALDNGRRSPRKLLRAVVARLLGLVRHLTGVDGDFRRKAIIPERLDPTLTQCKRGDCRSKEGAVRKLGVALGLCVTLFFQAGVAEAGTVTLIPFQRLVYTAAPAEANRLYLLWMQGGFHVIDVTAPAFLI